MHHNGHGIGDADLFNDQVGKIGKYRHRLTLAQENVLLEILFSPLFYHIAIIEAAGEPTYASQACLSLQIPYALLRPMVESSLVDLHPLYLCCCCRITLVEQRYRDHGVKSLTDGSRSL